MLARKNIRGKAIVHQPPRSIFQVRPELASTAFSYAKLGPHLLKSLFAEVAQAAADQFIARKVYQGSRSGVCLKADPVIGKNDNAFQGILKNGADSGFALPQSFFRPLALDGITNGAQEQPSVKRAFYKIILRALTHRFNSEILVIGTAQDQDGRSGRSLPDAIKSLIACAIF